MSFSSETIYAGIKNAVNVSEVFDWIDRTFAESHEPELDRDAMLRILGFGINHLAELTCDDPGTAQELIPGRVLDLCLERAEDDAKRYHYSEFRKSVVKWMEQYCEKEMCEIRQALLTEVAHRLKINPNQDLIWMVATIGYRDDEITPILKELALNEDGGPTIRDAALSTLCSLSGYSDDDSELFRSLAENRLKRITSIPLINVLRWLRSPNSVGFLLQALSKSSTEQQENYFPDLCLGALSEIAEAHPSVADTIWTTIVDTVRANNGTDRRPRVNELISNSSLLNKFDLEDVSKILLEFLVERTDSDENSKHFRYLIYLRLKELTGSRQLRGLCRDQRLEMMQLLEADCTLNTDNSTRSMSSNDRLKESAWDVALKMGLSEPLEWFNAITDEVSPFTRGRTLKLLACFSRRELPEIIGTWLTSRLDWTGGDFPEVFYIEPAIKMAAYSTDPRAFVWLLDLGITYRGEVPTNAADALTVYCMENIRNAEDKYVTTRLFVSKLIEAFQVEWNGKPDRVRQRRVLAAAALGAITSTHELIDAEKQNVIMIFKSLSITEDLFSLCSLAQIVIGTSHDEQIISRIEILAVHDNRWVAAHGIYALDYAGKSSTSQLVLLKQGIVNSDGKWVVNAPAKLSEQGAYLVGRFYLKDQNSAEDAVADVIRNGEWSAVSSLLHTLSRGAPVEDATSVVANAILSRISKKISYAYSEYNLFNELARFAPTVFLNVAWNDYWSGWSSESKIALVQATRESVQAGDAITQSSAVAILSFLELDAVQEVRQEARLAWSTIHKGSFDEAVSRRASTEATLVSDRRLSAEASWAITSEEKYSQVVAQLRSDPDRRVREACIESTKIRKERMLARENLDKVSSGLSSDTFMLAAWKHGEALEELGHFDHLNELLGLRSKSEISPNRRYWISLLAENLEKKIKEKKRKYIPDWSPPGTQVMRADGVVRFKEVQRTAVFVIRKWASGDLTEHQYWGGDGWFTDGMSHPSPSAEPIEILLNNGEGGNALISTSSLDSFSFSGMQWKVQKEAVD